MTYQQTDIMRQLVVLALAFVFVLAIVLGMLFYSSKASAECGPFQRLLGKCQETMSSTDGNTNVDTKPDPKSNLCNSVFRGVWVAKSLAYFVTTEPASCDSFYGCCEVKLFRCGELKPIASGILEILSLNHVRFGTIEGTIEGTISIPDSIPCPEGLKALGGQCYSGLTMTFGDILVRNVLR